MKINLNCHFYWVTEVWSTQTSTDGGFFPSDALPGLYCSYLQFIFVCSWGGVCHQQVRHILSCVQVRWLNWSLQNIPLFWWLISLPVMTTTDSKCKSALDRLSAYKTGHGTAKQLVSFQIQCGRIYNQVDENWVKVKILMNLTVCDICLQMPGSREIWTSQKYWNVYCELVLR